MPVYFGEIIRRGRKAAGLTQKALARELGVSNTSVSNWEKDLSRPDADTISALCALLHLEPNSFYGGPTRENRPVSEDDIKFALFGGDGEITDAMFDEVKQFAAFVKEREKRKE